MSDLSLGKLSWLCPPPAAFRKTLKDLVAAPGTVDGSTLVGLARHDLDLNKLTILDKAITALADRLSGSALSQVRLALLAQATTDYVAPAIRASALRHGLLVETYVPPYGQAMAEVMDAESPLRGFAPEIALIAETAQSLGLTRVHVEPLDAESAVAGAVATLTALVEGLQGAGTRTVILQTIPLPADPWCGQFDRRAKGSVAAQIAAVNQAMAELCDSHAAVLFDADAIAGLVGRASWHDAGLWQRAKVPFALDFAPLYAEKFTQLLRALRGKASKCLVLDLDNTCWGGVIGDDGLEGIAIGQGSAEGEAFLAIQNYALSLKARGVVLAVCSKNEEANAKLPFESHPDMALRLDDFAVFVANWTDKASNLAHIAKVLNIGIDSLVFLDDNPAERERVRQMLPEVAVPEVGEDPVLYPAMIAQGGYFETVGLSADDAKRAEQYRANAERTVAMETIGDYGAYLRSLDMECAIAPFDSIGRTRIAQLINKSNQFNLTTRRYTEAEVAAMEADTTCHTLQVRLTDKFGDNGMISVVVFRDMEGEKAWLCDTWLMSCRVLKRRIEEAVLAHVAVTARARGVDRLYGDYIPSVKNAMVKDHFENLGFTQHGPLEGGGTRWVLELEGYVAPDLPMTLDLRTPIPA